jgi:hypothetical protein
LAGILIAGIDRLIFGLGRLSLGLTGRALARIVRIDLSRRDGRHEQAGDSRQPQSESSQHDANPTH